MNKYPRKSIEIKGSGLVVAWDQIVGWKNKVKMAMVKRNGFFFFFFVGDKNVLN